MIQSAIKRIENKAETSRPDPLAEAIGRLKYKVAKTGPRQGYEKSDGIGIGGKLGLEQIDIYKIEIASLINKNWAYSEQLAGGRTDLEAWLGIKIMKNGQIKDIFSRQNPEMPILMSQLTKRFRSQIHYHHCPKDIHAIFTVWACTLHLRV